MFPDCCWHKNQFARTPRYNARWTGAPSWPAGPWAEAGLAGFGNHHPYSLFLDDDMTDSTGAQDPAAGTSALLQPWRRIAQQLCPLIGESGFCALFGRAIHVMGPQYSWLALQQPCRSPEQLFGLLEERMGQVDAACATAANDILLQTFTQLLATLIGEALTRRLFASATASADQPANVQEHK